MWYRSSFTKKIVSSTYFRTLNLVYGDGTTDRLISAGVLIPVKNPSVIDILRDNGSQVGAIMRYREIHECTLSEARDGVNMLKEDMARISQMHKSHRKHKRNRMNKHAD